MNAVATRSDSERRRDALKYLAVARQADADPTVAVVYQTALADLRADFLEAACKELALEPREDFKPALPSVGEIRARVVDVSRRDQQRHAAAKLLPMPRRNHPDEPTFHCVKCEDEPNAWRAYWCHGAGQDRVSITEKLERHKEATTSPCARQQTHGPHTYVEHCECSDTNPVIAKHRERQAAFRQKSAGKR